MLKRTFLLVLLVSIAPQFLFGAARINTKSQAGRESLTYDKYKTISTNLLEMFIYNFGNFAYDNANVYGKTDGLYFPRGTRKTVVYDAGIWIGAKVNNQTRIAVAEYSSEFATGPMEGETYLPDCPDFRVYKIKRGDDMTNSDYRDWPVAMGAPVDQDGKPMLIGDQMTWAVYNDADSSRHVNSAGSTNPLGVEIQQTTVAFERSSALGHAIFIEFRIINKGGNQLDSAYVSIWADPDLGDASDDLVGCDTLLSLGYCYNSGADAVYGAVPPAVGIDFFQGPIVPGSPTDSARVTGEWRHGYKNLPMTSFNLYVNGTDPGSPLECYNYMKGLTRSGMPVVNPMTNEVTTYVVSGDPQAGTGWIDATPADKRMMLSSGPFTMMPGDTQAVIVAIMVGQGTDALASIGALKEIDTRTQSVFDLNFDIPVAPPSPSVYVRGLDGVVELTWGSEPVGDEQMSPELGQDFLFEGFDLYQGESVHGPWHKFATYDEFNDVAFIYGDVYDPDAGGIQRVIVQRGSNSGLIYHTSLGRNQLDNMPFVNGQPYYFAVTSYSYDHANVTEFLDQGGNLLGHLTETLESWIIGYEATPVIDPGVVADTAYHITGVSDGMVIANYLTPDLLNGHRYEVSFNPDLTWNLVDSTACLMRLTNQTHQEPDYDFAVVDGMMVRTIGPSPGIKNWTWEGGTRWLTGEEAFGGNLALLNGGLWNGPDFFGSNIDETKDYVDVEIRFSPTITQKAYDYLRGGYPNYGFIGYFECPFTIWDVSTNPARQLNALFVENASASTYDSTWFPGVSGVESREYIFIMKSTYSETINPNYADKFPNMDAGDMDILYVLTPKIRPGHDPNTEFEEGQKLIILAAKPNVPADRFQFYAGFRCGDVDADSQSVVNSSDVVYLISYVFGDGPAPRPVKSGDVDNNGRIDLSDVVYLINYIFGGGHEPCYDCN